MIRNSHAATNRQRNSRKYRKYWALKIVFWIYLATNSTSNITQICIKRPFSVWKWIKVSVHAMNWGTSILNHSRSVVSFFSGNEWVSGVSGETATSVFELFSFPFVLQFKRVIFSVYYFAHFSWCVFISVFFLSVPFLRVQIVYLPRQK